MGGSIQQGYAIVNPGVITLLGANDQLAAEDYTASQEIALDANGPASGEVLSVSLIASESGAGSVLASQGTLYLFDSDPAITLQDAALAGAGAGHAKCIGYEDFVTADWKTDASGGIACKTVAIPFGRARSLWAAFFLNAGETTINSAGGDDELLRLRLAIRRDQ